MVTLAIDPSTKSTGWSIFEGQELKDYGCITASSNNLFNNQNVYKALVYLQGFLMNEFDKHGLKVTYYVASVWRKKCAITTGRGVTRESLKPKDISFVRNQFGINTNDDVADAICIGFAHVGGIVKKPQIEITDDGFEFR